MVCVCVSVSVRVVVVVVVCLFVLGVAVVFSYHTLLIRFFCLLSKRLVLSITTPEWKKKIVPSQEFERGESVKTPESLAFCSNIEHTSEA